MWDGTVVVFLPNMLISWVLSPDPPKPSMLAPALEGDLETG